jgi:hypothetical protein
VKKEIAEIKARQTVYEQTVEAKAAVAAAVAETTAGIDLKKFWNP